MVKGAGEEASEAGKKMQRISLARLFLWQLAKKNNSGEMRE